VTTPGTRTQSNDDSSYREISGRVGSDVAAVVLNTLQRGPVQATVSQAITRRGGPVPRSGAWRDLGRSPPLALTVKDGTTCSDIPMAEVDLSPPR